MKRISFATQLVLLWTLVAMICMLLIVIVWLFVQTDQKRQVSLASQQASLACENIGGRYALSNQLNGGTLNIALMHAVLDTVLIRSANVEGGFWTPVVAGGSSSAPLTATLGANHATATSAKMTEGFLAYSFPTYEGTGVKRDVPQAETPLILRALRRAAAGHLPVSDSVPNGQGATVAAACPVAGSSALYVWTLTRAQAPLGKYGHLLVVSLAAVLTGILAIAVILGISLRRWKQNLSVIDRALSSDIASRWTELSPVGEADLDRIIRAVNAFADRSRTSQAAAFALSEQLQQAERFASLGKLAAQVAHEIRNPLGAVRLKLENVIAHDEGVRRQQLMSALAQVDRIESQVTSLLALTQPVTSIKQSVNVSDWLTATIATHEEQAKQKDIVLLLDIVNLGPASEEIEGPCANFDPMQMARALDNLILNAIRHTPSGGNVKVKADRVQLEQTNVLRIQVGDNGPGVPSAERESIFKPFVTGRPDGSGLGLAVVREVATAHGGHAYLADTQNGACFVIEIPWHTYS